MTALIAPVIPSSARPSARGLGRAGTARRLPVADVPVIRAAPEDVVYGFGRIDASGRVADRAITGALGWQPGDRLTLAADAGVVIARRDPGGMVTMRTRPCIVIPAALRCLYRRAEDDGLIAGANNPARKVAKPRRLPSTRRAVPDTRLAEINQAAATTGNDPELDTLLLRLHTETACRRGGALALRAQDLDQDQCLVLLREKGETVRWQPVSPTLMARLIQHAQQRHAPPHGQLLRYPDGRPVTSRRYDHLWTRIGRVLPWVATQQVSIHWIRHTTLTWVERNFGYAVARAYAGHTDGGSETGATSTYVRASISEVAAALAALTGEPHPLATTEGW